MNDDTLNPNFEWKKKSLGKKERLSRRINTHQAEKFRAQKKDNFSLSLSLKSDSTSNFGKNLNKMRKRIRDVFDDEEDEEEESSIFLPEAAVFEEENIKPQNSLFSAYSEDEIRTARQQQILDEIRMQREASKRAALSTLNHLAQRAGLPGLSVQDTAENMLHDGWGKETFKAALEQSIAPDIKTGNKHPNPEKIKQLMKGLKRLKNIGGFNAVQGMKINEVIKITDSRFDDDKVAKMLLKKTGRKPHKAYDYKAQKKRYAPKVSFKKLLQKRQEGQVMKA